MDKQKIEKFDELEISYSDDKEMLNFTKAVWLTSRANYFGKNKMFVEAIADLEEAISLKNDYLPAYLSMATVYSFKEGVNFDDGIQIIEKAPSETRLNGNIITTKKEIMDEFKKTIEEFKQTMN